jgi:menaquinone-dependent protoporphyrinogen oxidase
MRVAVFYATREGQSARVAERVARDLRSRPCATDVVNVKEKDVRGQVDWDAYDGAFVVASVHAEHHEPEMIEFVKRSKEQLERLRASFLSLTLSEAGAEMTHNTPEQRAAAHADAVRMIDGFTKETGWRPEHSLTVAGALAYSKYNFFIRWIMKRIAHKAGFDGPATRDYEFTNWPSVDRFVEEHAPSA